MFILPQLLSRLLRGSQKRAAARRDRFRFRPSLVELEERRLLTGPIAPIISFSADQSTVSVSYNSYNYTIPRPVVVPWSYTASGATYWVATTGKDTNPGTSASPFLTINKAVSVAAPGDIVYIKSGTYVENLVLTTSGTAAKPIIISCAPGALGTVTITPSAAFVTNNPDGSVIDVNAADYIWINGLNIEGPMGRPEAPLAEDFSADGITWENAAGLGDRATNNVVYANVHCGMKEMHHGGTNIDVEGNVIFANGADSLSHGIYMPADNSTMNANVIFNNASFGIHSYPSPQNQIITNNVLWGNPSGGIILGGASNQVYHNTVAYSGTGSVGIFYFRGGCTNNIVEDNIAVFNDTDAGWDNGSGQPGYGSPANNTDDYNDYLIVDPHVTKGTHELTADPVFVNPAIGDFRLQPGSPCLGKGINTGALSGNSTLDLGAYSGAALISGPVIVDNGGAGYSETGAWTTETVPAYGGNERYATSSGSGQNTATWQVQGLAAGAYQVQVSWHPYGNQATNAPYAIYDGSTLLQTVTVNQTMAASGAQFGGVPFQTLTAVNITSGTLKVVLSNTGNGVYIVADAMRLAPVQISNTDLNWSATGDGITGPTSLTTQGTFTISRTYTIGGAAAPANFNIVYYASTSSSTTQDLTKATLLGSETLSAAADLSAGNHAGSSPTFQIPLGGTYYLFAKLVADPSWAESDSANDTNDVAVTAQPVQVSGAIIVANGSAGYSETGTWNTENVPAYGNSERYATSTGTGQNTATWQVTGLPGGQYVVQVSWHPYYNQATNAPYAIYDGSTLLQTVLVDQTQPGKGDNFGGVPFQTLATVNITSGALKVVLSNTGNGTYIVANAVRVAPVPLINPVIVSNGDAGYAETGTWMTENVPAYGNSERYAASSGTGQNTATWQTTALPAGQYVVQVTWHKYYNQATNAPYAIYDGSTLLQTVKVDQTQSPNGPSFGGVSFQTLATVTITSGTLKLVLSNTGNGVYIVANAMRVAPLTASNTDLNWSASGDGISGPASTSSQTTFTINRTYTVSGAAAPGPFSIAYYASTSASLTQDLSKALLLGTETLSATADLAVGNHAGASPALQIRSGGTYYLFAKVSADPSWLESNQTNNLAVAAQPVQVSGPVVVDNGDPGYSETGTWNTETVPAYGGTERYAASGGTGKNTAAWLVTGLAGGQYQVQATWHRYPNEATNAPYAIYDGSALLTTVLVDQTQTPNGAMYGGVAFQTLATVHISSGSLKVVLSDTANGAYIVADAIGVVPA